jgi:hypothetical protein
MGASAHEVVQSIFEKWLNENPNFNRVSEFYQGASNSAHGFFMMIILPAFVKWLEGYWNVLRGSVDLADAMEMDVRFSEAELVKASRYTLLAHNAAQIQAQPASGGGAGPTANDPPAGTPALPGTEFQATIAGKPQCRHCHSLGKVPPATNHDMKGCNTLRKALGTPRKRGRDSWGAESKWPRW